MALSIGNLSRSILNGTQTVPLQHSHPVDTKKGPAEKLFAECGLMPKLAKNAPKYPDTPDSIIARLSWAWERDDDPMAFQIELLEIAYSHGHVSIAEQVGVRRETLWRYKTGAARAPFETLIKIMAAVGAKLVVVRR